jgi:acetoin utilization protein AcuC
LCAIADQLGHGRVVGMGGGGYNRRNLARAWTRVVGAFVDATPAPMTDASDQRQ